MAPSLAGETNSQSPYPVNRSTLGAPRKAAQKGLADGIGLGLSGFGMESGNLVWTGPAALASNHLESIDFLGADLRGKDFSNTRFHNCELRGARLDWANLAGASLNHARLLSASLTNVHARGAAFKGANLRNGRLTFANLMGADMTGANLLQADLTGANLCGARCLWGDITKARFTGALYDEATLLPPGFRPEAEGMVRFDTGRA